MTGPGLFRVRPEDYYIVINHYGRFGPAFAETDLYRADYETTVTDLMTGQHSDPLRVIMFNTDANRAEDFLVTKLSPYMNDKPEVGDMK